MFELRPYQADLIEEIKLNLKKGSKKILANCATGYGKSVVIRTIFQMALEKNPNAKLLYTVHRSILVNQVKETLKGLNVEVSTLQRIGRNKSITWDLHLADEVHYGFGSKLFGNIDSKFFIGLTATGITTDGFALDGFDCIIDSAQLVDLINMGYMPPLKVISNTKVDTSKLKTVNGDFSVSESFSLMNKSTIYQDILGAYNNFAKGLKSIIYCVNVMHSENVKETFLKAGLRVESYHSKKTKKEREDILKRFKNNELDILTNCDTLTTGLDIKDIYALIIAAPCKSYIRAIQIYGRLRLNNEDPNKVGIIIDLTETVRNTCHPLDKLDIHKKKQDKGSIKCKCKAKMKLTNRFTKVLNDYEYAVISDYKCPECEETQRIENIKLVNHSLCENCNNIFEPASPLKMTTSQKDVKFVTYCKCCGYERVFRSILYTDDELKEVSLHQAMTMGATWKDVDVILKAECKKAGYHHRYTVRLIDRCKNANYSPKQVIEFIKTIKVQKKKISQLMYI